MAGAQAEDYIKLCELRELFHGRFTDQESATLLEINNNDLRAAANDALSSESQELRQRLEDATWVAVKSVKRKVRSSSQTILQAAKTGSIDTTCRQFACGPCDTYWWRRTPERKTVSRCTRCRVKYDPVPRHREWGWAEFQCQHCGNTYAGWCAMYMTAPCYQCRVRNRPLRIVPPDANRPRTPFQRRSQHACDAWDCICKWGPNGNQPPQPPPPGTPEYEHRCVHPASRRKNHLPVVVEPSANHDSSGSTVATFLPQADLALPQELFFTPPLPSIPE